MRPFLIHFFALKRNKAQMTVQLMGKLWLSQRTSLSREKELRPSPGVRHCSCLSAQQPSHMASRGFGVMP